MTNLEHHPIRIAIVNNYEVVVHGLSAMLQPCSDRVEVVEVEAGGLPEHPADIVLFDTSKTHVRKVFGKLDVTNRTQAAIVARDRGLEILQGPSVIS